MGLIFKKKSHNTAVDKKCICNQSSIQNGKIGVCCYSTEVERNAKYHVNITFYRYWLSGNYEQRLGRFSFKIGACCYTPLKTAQ